MVTMADSEESISKRSEIVQRLQRRHDERLITADQKKNEKDQESAQFISCFAKLRDEIETSLTMSGDDLEHVSTSIQRLQKLLTDSTSFLTTYDIQKSQTVVNKLKQAIELKKGELAPKKKFAFKTDKKKSLQVKVANASQDETLSSDVIGDKKDSCDAVLCGFTNCQNEMLILTGADIEGKDVILSKLTNCRVILQGAPSTVHVNKLHQSTILCGPTSGSVFVDECDHCTIVVACQQLRIHSTVDSVFCLHITSRSIIEDCKNLSFSSYNWIYTSLEEDFQRARLDQHRNNWNCIDDFNWLASDQPSPNWSILDSELQQSCSALVKEIATSSAPSN